MFDLKKIEELLANEPAFRMKQVKRAVFCNLVSSWDEVTVLGKDLRAKLDKKTPLEIEVLESKGRFSSKALFDLAEGDKVEAVLMRHKDGRNTVCVSTQVGCSMGCKFCATGKMGLTRNLTVSEMVEQVLYFARKLAKRDVRVSNVVFMGMGEPFMNYDNVMGAVRMLNDRDGLNIGARHISISTVGVMQGIERLASDDLQVNLALSLHAPNDPLRKKIMPKAYDLASIDELFGAVDNYMKKTNRKVMFEYLMLDGVNNSKRQAQELVELLRGDRRRLSMVNLIAYNENDIPGFRSPDREKIDEFKSWLEKEGLEVTTRHSFGNEFQGACGQLAVNR